MAGGYVPNSTEARYLRWLQCINEFEQKSETKLTIGVRATTIDIAQLVQEQGMFPTNRNIHNPSKGGDHIGNISIQLVVKAQLSFAVTSHSPGSTLGVQ